MKILVSYRGIPQSPGWATGDFVVKAFRSLGHEVWPYGNYYTTDQTIEGWNSKELLDRSYDLYLQMECGDGDRFYSEIITNAHCLKRASWWFDSALYIDRWRHETAMISSDVNFIANKSLVGQNFNDVYLPYAADYEKHANPICYENGSYWIRKDGSTYGLEKTIDFLIIGSPRPEREQLYKAISRAVPNAAVAYITNAFREEYVSYLTRSHYVVNDVAGGGAGLLPMRCTETIAAGSHLITPHDDGCKELNIPCFEYRNTEELLLLCKELNQRPRPIRFGFQEKFLENHTYKNRCETILERIFN